MNEYSINLPESTFNDLDKDTPVYSIKNAETTQEKFENAMLQTLEKLKTPEKVTKRKQNAKTPKVTPMNLKGAKRKSSKDAEMKKSKIMNVTSTTGLFQYNKDTGRYETKIQIDQNKWITVYNSDNPNRARFLLEGYNGQGKILKEYGISKLKITTKDGKTYTYTKGEKPIKAKISKKNKEIMENTPKVPSLKKMQTKSTKNKKIKEKSTKKAKISKKTEKKAKITNSQPRRNSVPDTFKKIKGKMIGQGQLQGASRDCTVMSFDKGVYTVHSIGVTGMPLTFNFNSNFEQIGGQPQHYFTLELETA